MKTTIAALLICAAPAFAANEEFGAKVPGGPVIVKPVTEVKLGELTPTAAAVKTPELAAPAAASVTEAQVPSQPAGAISAQTPGSSVEPSAAKQDIEAAKADPKDKPTIASLKAELRSLRSERWANLFGAGMIGARFHDAPSVAAAQSQESMNAKAVVLIGKIEGKKAEIAQLKKSNEPQVKALKAQIAELKSRRFRLVMASGMISVRQHDAPSYEAAQSADAMVKEARRLDAEIRAKQKELAELR